MDTPPPELVSRRRNQSSGGPATTVFMVLGFLLAAVGALVMFANLLRLHVPQGTAAGVAAAGLVLLPAVWHALAERCRRLDAQAFGGGLARFVLRAVAVNGLLTASAFASLGPAGVRARVGDVLPALQKSNKSAPATKRQPTGGSTTAPAGQALESFVPSDATMVVGMSGSKALQTLLSAHGPQTQERLEAMQKCHIELDSAQVVIAARGAHEHMALARAPGITDEGNLYCLVGALGNERLAVKFNRETPQRRFTVQGLLPAKTLSFTDVGNNTLLMVDEPWRLSVEERLGGEGEALDEGQLSAALKRTNRASSVWAASVTHTANGAWDLALAAESSETHFRMKVTSVPPAGAEHMAQASLDVPVAFATGLPAGAISQTAMGLVGAVAATGSALPPPPPAPEVPARP